MKIEQKTNVDCFCISDAKALDPITVFLNDNGDKSGMITIVCYGQAWSAYFGSMGCGLNEFLRSVSTDYLAGKMELPKSKKHEIAYLHRIVDAVLLAIKDGY